MKDFLKNIQERPEEERRIIFWVLVILFGIVFFGFWLLLIKQQVGSLNREKIKQELNLPQFQESFKNLPTPQLPKIDEEQLKQLENALKQEAPTP